MNYIKKKNICHLTYSPHVDYNDKTKSKIIFDFFFIIKNLVFFINYLRIFLKMFGNNTAKVYKSEFSLPNLKNSHHKSLTKSNCYLNSHSSIDNLSDSSYDSKISKAENEFKQNFVRNESRLKAHPKFLPKYSEKNNENSKFMCLFDSKKNYFPFEDEIYKKKKTLNLKNPIDKYQYHFGSYCSINYITTVIKIYEELIINYLSEMNIDKHFLPRVQFLRSSKKNFNKEPIDSLDKFVNRRRKNVSKMIKKATEIVEGLQKIIRQKEKNSLKNSENYFLDGMSELSLDIKYDVWTIGSSISNSIESLFDPYEEYKNWVIMCTNEFKNWE